MAWATVKTRTTTTQKTLTVKPAQPSTSQGAVQPCKVCHGTGRVKA